MFFGHRNFTRDKLLSHVIFSAFLGQALSYSKVYLFHIVVLFVFLILLLRKELDVFLKFDFKKHLIFCYLLIWSFASAVLSPDKTLALKGLFYILCGVGILLAWNLIQDKSFIYKGLFYLYLANLVLGLLEAFTPIRWPISCASPWLELFKKENFGDYPLTYQDYPTGFFWHPNNASLIVLLGFPIILNSKKIKSTFKILITSLGLIFIAKAGAKAILILSVLYLLYFILTKNILFQLKSSKSYLMLALILSLFITVFYSFNNEQRNEFLTSLEVVTNYGKSIITLVTRGHADGVRGEVSERIRFMIGAVDLIKENLFFGIGINQNANLLVDVLGTPTSLKSIHNYWIELLLTGGLILFVPVFSWLLFKLMVLMRRMETRALGETLGLFILGVVAMSSAVYFLPQWIIYCIISDQNSFTD